MKTLALFCGVLFCAAAQSETYDILKTETILSVVTHKAGIASGWAHNHLVYPTAYDAEASADPAHPDQAVFRLRFPVTALAVDDPDVQQIWITSILDAGILDKPFQRVSEKDRGDIKESMLSKDQLDAKDFPTITAELKGIEAAQSTLGNKTFPYKVRIALTVRGRTVEHPLAANIEVAGEKVHVEAAGTYAFTEFGIKPFSAFLGAVRNQDVFHVYVNLKAVRQETQK